MVVTDRDDNSMLTSDEIASARRMLESLPAPVAVKVIQTGNPLSAQLRGFVGALAAVSRKLKPIYQTETGDAPPAIEVQANLRYHALPSGLELAPFLQALSTRALGKSRLNPRTVWALRDFITPTQVKVLIGPMCPHCPAVAGLASQLALANSYLDISVIDISLFDGHVAGYDVRAVPTIIIDGQDQLAGEVSEEILVDRLIKRRPSHFHPDTFKKIVKEGDAERLACMMTAEGEVYSGALKLLADGDWSVRLGMMVVLEEVADRRADMAPLAYSCLLALLKHQDPNRRGDAAYLLGQIGDVSVLDKLRLLETDPNPDVADAAREAAEKIKSRHNFAG